MFKVKIENFINTFKNNVIPKDYPHLFLIDGGALAVENALKVAMDWKYQKNMDLGIKFAEENGWAQDKIDNLKWTEKKVNKKFEKPFFGKPAAPNASAMEEEWQRFLNA